MSVLNFETLGQPLTHCKIVPGNTATGIGSEFYIYTERDLAFTSGGTTEIVVGDWIVGATSAAKAEVVGVTLASGTWAGGTAAGTLRIKNQHGTFQSENLKVAAGTNDATIAANSVLHEGDYFYKGTIARTALVTVIANTQLINIEGGKPDQTALVGISMVANTSLVLNDIIEIKNFKTIDYTAGSAGTVNVICYF